MPPIAILLLILVSLPVIAEVLAIIRAVILNHGMTGATWIILVVLLVLNILTWLTAGRALSYSVERMFGILATVVRSAAEAADAGQVEGIEGKGSGADDANNLDEGAPI
jgi:hypothetical protein